MEEPRVAKNLKSSESGAPKATKNVKNNDLEVAKTAKLNKTADSEPSDPSKEPKTNDSQPTNKEDPKEKNTTDQTTPDISTSESQAKDDQNSSKTTTQTVNYSEYEKVWFMIFLDRARQIHETKIEDKITSSMYRTFCALLLAEENSSKVTRTPSMATLKNIWANFYQHKQVKRRTGGGPKLKETECRNEIEALMKQGLSLRQILKELQPAMKISLTTVANIVRQIKKDESRLYRAIKKEKKLCE